MRTLELDYWNYFLSKHINLYLYSSTQTHISLVIIKASATPHSFYTPDFQYHVFSFTTYKVDVISNVDINWFNTKCSPLFDKLCCLISRARGIQFHPYYIYDVLIVMPNLLDIFVVFSFSYYLRKHRMVQDDSVIHALHLE